MSLESTAIFDRRVYAQDTAPDDERDGVIWVDTSVANRTMYTYSADSAAWEQVSSDVPVLVTQEAVSFDESGVTQGTHSALKAKNGSVGFDSAVDATTSRTADNNTANYTDTEKGVEFNPNQALNRLYFTVSANTGTEDWRSQLYDAESGDLLVEQQHTAVGAGDTLSVDHPMSEGHTYAICLADPADGTSSSFGYYDETFPISGTALDIVDGSSGGSSSNYRAFCVNDLRGVYDATRGQRSIGFSSIPTDLSAWDIATWQYDAQDGTIEEMRVETNDGTGWATHTSGLPPVDISGVPTDSDVRVWFDLSRPSTTETGPEIPYVARRGER